jgi:uncharacterized membrane protein YgcG
MSDATGIPNWVWWALAGGGWGLILGVAIRRALQKKQAQQVSASSEETEQLADSEPVRVPPPAVLPRPRISYVPTPTRPEVPSAKPAATPRKDSEPPKSSKSSADDFSVLPLSSPFSSEMYAPSTSSTPSFDTDDSSKFSGGGGGSFGGSGSSGDW